MKRGTENLLKFQHLQRDLGLAEYEAVGLLQTLWNKTDINCPRGDIGKFSNEDIAVIVDWRRDPDELINALVRRCWIDEHPEHRLIIHDWPAHCENTTHRKVARAKEFFADGSTPNLSGLGKEQSSIEDFYEREAEKRDNVITFSSTESKRDHELPENSPPSTPTVTKAIAIAKAIAVTDTKQGVVEDPPPLPIEVFREAWNAMAAKHGLSQCREMTDKRKVAFKARWKDPGWRRDYTGAIIKVPESEFLLGKNGRGWKADVDWFLSPDSVTKILEEKYGGVGGTKTIDQKRDIALTHEDYHGAFT